MEKQFWLDKWQKRELGFHQPEVHELLRRYFHCLELTAGNHVFVPLCGKSLDIHWLLNQGLNVVGIELSEAAVTELFDELKVQPQVDRLNNLKRYQHENLNVYVGDFFDLTAADLPKIDAVYDRAAIIALPETMRQQYAQHLLSITHNAQQLLITLEYDTSIVSGPPFVVTEAEINHSYAEVFQVAPLESLSVPNGLKGNVDVVERVWLLS